MTYPLQRFANWFVFAASVAYGLWSFGKLLSVLFNLGENETAQATLGILVFGLAPFPTSFVALRWRKSAATVFCVVAVLFVAGLASDLNGALARGLVVRLILMVSPLLVFAAFYLTTDFLRWPKLLGKREPTV